MREMINEVHFLNISDSSWSEDSYENWRLKSNIIFMLMFVNIYRYCKWCTCNHVISTAGDTKLTKNQTQWKWNIWWDRLITIKRISEKHLNFIIWKYFFFEQNNKEGSPKFSQKISIKIFFIKINSDWCS